MRIVVARKQGQAVRALVERGAIGGIEIAPAGRPEGGLTDLADLAWAIEAARRDVIVKAGVEAIAQAAARSEWPVTPISSIRCRGRDRHEATLMSSPTKLGR
jgi:hypothetical protein